MNTESITVLISSVSKKIPLIKSVRRALHKIGVESKIVGGDADPDCIGKYFVDQFWQMPPLPDLTPEEFISYCQFYGINLVIPTRDGELLFFAGLKDMLEQQGIHVMISEEEAVSICLDKEQFYQTLIKLGYPVIDTVSSLVDLDWDSYVVKERFGAGSYSIGIDLTKEQAQKHAKKLKNSVFQPYVKGDEVSVDLYVDRTGKTKGVIARKREMVVNGESQVTNTFRDENLEKMCANMAEELKLYGHVMFQLIHHEVNGVYYVLECNPRFGGASALSLEMGLDSFFWFFQEVMGEDLSKIPFERSDEEKRLVRYPEDLIVT
ncbi:MAG: hypothetical protein K940chlam7_01324 [Chlamydiae bacterium]|nr:hypothetical protein [Chlamydiota bacterium]